MVDSEDLNLTNTELLEMTLDPPQTHIYILRLYIAGATLQSGIALRNLKKICEEHLQGRYKLEVIDIYQHPETAIADNIVAVPTLVKELPPPLQRMIGNLSNIEKVLIRLDIFPKTSP